MADLNPEQRKLTGLDVVMTGFAGLCGSVKIAEAKETELLSRYPEVFIEKAKGQKELLQKEYDAALKWPEAESEASVWIGAAQIKDSDCTVKAIVKLSEAGVFAGLRRLGDETGVGLEIELKKIPVKQETIEICNFFDINPYILKSDGCAIILTENGYRLVHELEKEGTSAAIIGITRDNNDRVVVNGEEKRFLEKRYVDQIYQVLQKK